MPFEKFERPPEIETEKEVESEKTGQEKFREFLVEQTSLPEREWSEEFKDYVKEKYKEETAEIPERSPEEQRRLVFLRYLKGLDLDPEDLRGKRILDLGCSEEGEFVRECLDRGITEETYGLDLRIEPETFEGKYRSHLFQGNFEDKFPVKNLDLIISFGSVEAPTNKYEKRNPERTLNFALKALKEDGEIRIFPLRKSPPGARRMAGINFARKKWVEVLEKLSSKEKIDYELQPIDIKAAGKGPDVWLEEVLIIRKRKPLKT